MTDEQLLEWLYSDIDEAIDFEYKEKKEVINIAKEIILSEQKEPCDFCKHIYTIEATSYTYTEPIASLSGLNEINYCPKCGRPLN